MIIGADGRKLTSKDNTTKFTIDQVEIPIPNDAIQDLEQLKGGALVPQWAQMQVGPGQAVFVAASLKPGLTAAEVLLLVETARALQKRDEAIEKLESRIAELERAQEEG